MALFPYGDAARAAVDVFRSVEEYNTKKPEGLPAVSVGVGVCTGPVVLGSIGIPERMEISVIGDTVNVASRLEALTRNFGVQCLVSPEVAKDAEKKGLTTRFVGEIRLKGRSTATSVSELLTTVDPLIDVKIANSHGLSGAIESFRDGHLEECQEKLSSLAPGDPVAHLYLTQSKKMLADLKTIPPPPLVIVMETK